MRTVVEVNLLPAEYEPPNPYTLRNILFLAISLIIVVFLALDYHQISEKRKAFEQHSQGLALSIGRFRKLKKNIDLLRERTTLLKERSKIITEIAEQRVTWADKLSEIYLKVPTDSLWLEQVTLERRTVRVAPVQTETPKAKSTNKSRRAAATAKAKAKADQKPAAPPKPQELIFVHITGDAKDISHVAEFIFRLEETSFLENAQFRSIDQREKEGQSVMAFEVIAQVNLKGNIQL